ncbi:hypothetical protein CDD81_1664 [Ophiocordyceps australis]|uniref:Mso1 N-terminal domain-containing protein n=1 Tax=Ophiocordyceps australis TaxID=1399860 RepID=A0A2C5XZ63_9HYPO|nr:hypothetical protein CDD81_1664 [Ophiocordyceps australis]
MSSWYSNILTKTTSQISSLRSTLLASDTDGDTEDDTHVCRVLRAYYLDSGRPLPPWLPPDARTPQAQAAAAAPPATASSASFFSPLTAANSTPQNPGGLSSLWDSSPRPAAGPRRETAASVGSLAQDRLRQRLWGQQSRTGSPTQVAGIAAPPPPQPQQAPQAPQRGDYEDRFAPGGAYDVRRATPEPARQGLPPGPRRGGGLPSGPRGYR